MRSNISLKLLRDLDDRVERIIFQTPFVTAYELNNNEQYVYDAIHRTSHQMGSR